MKDNSIDLEVKEKLIGIPGRLVKQDICIEFHNLHFSSKSNRRRNNEKLIGDPVTLRTPYEIFKRISQYEYHLMTWGRNKNRFLHTLENIRFIDDPKDDNKVIIDLLFSCTDTEALPVINKNSKDRSRKTFNFEENEGHEKLCHAVFLGRKDSHFGRFHLEAGQNTTANQISSLLQKILKSISMLDKKDIFFYEIYPSTLDTPFYIEYIPKIEPVPEEDVVNKLSKGEFFELVLEHKNLFSIAPEADFVTATKQQIVFKPSIIAKTLKTTVECLENLNALASKYAPPKAKETITVFKLVLKDGKRQKCIEIRPESATLESFGTKKHWLNGFERVQILTEENMYDDNLCLKLRTLNLNQIEDLQLDDDQEI
ncbi:hypothetical protein E3H47_14695 (plasmid) [Acinetobacter radioresistens]|uniref:hypothetical protein n=1 Tax=Acinetobacter radioresistens TaxID=40216 RepID=UPI0010CCCD75|nr:hypothetical protein [Acinetobacter radioresistens]QCS13764.1 hypothetical protein E3H47_14695 [Acinetobacter radioresistens]